MSTGMRKKNRRGNLVEHPNWMNRGSLSRSVICHPTPSAVM